MMGKITTQIIFTLLMTTMLGTLARGESKPVRVFILAGQSNMQGQGFVKSDPKRNGGKGSLEFLVQDPATAKRFAHLIDAQGRFLTRGDVWISYLDRKG